MIEILASGALNTVQDLGRSGTRRYGVGTSGVMDRLALIVGNSLLGNEDAAACIEVQTFPFRLRFRAATGFAVTGADCAATLGERRLPPWWATTARPGDELTLHPPRAGARAYVTVQGGIDVPVVLGSRSTHLRNGFGGRQGRPLQAGDTLDAEGDAAQRPPAAELGAEPPDLALPPCRPVEDGCLALRVLRGGDFELFPEAAQQRVWETQWRISPQSDRGGYRLSGEKLLLEHPVEMRSYGVVPGIVQVPPAGEPIIQLSDANTAGGYPKLGGVIAADLWRLGQARIGSRISFVETSYEEAIEADRPVEAYLAKLRRLAALHRRIATR